MDIGFSREHIKRVYDDHKCCGARILLNWRGSLYNLAWNGVEFTISEQVSPNEIDLTKCEIDAGFCIFKHAERLCHPQHDSAQLISDCELFSYIRLLQSLGSSATNEQRRDLAICKYERNLRTSAHVERIRKGEVKAKGRRGAVASIVAEKRRKPG